MDINLILTWLFIWIDVDSVDVLSVRVLLLDLQGSSVIWAVCPVIWAVCPGNGPVPNAPGMAGEQPGVWLGKELLPSCWHSVIWEESWQLVPIWAL